MKAYVGVTDWTWFQFLRDLGEPEEVNFWQPSGSRQFRALKPGEMFLFKLHSPRNFIVGGGVFAHSTLLPVSLAWDAFQESNGAPDLDSMRDRVSSYRRVQADPFDDYTVGCILLVQPFFLPENLWVPAPSDWKPNLVQGRGYDLQSGLGRDMWESVQAALAGASSARVRRDSERDHLIVGAGSAREPADRYGTPSLVRPRLGQGTFRVAVTDAYERRCVITGERTLPALEAAHIKPYTKRGEHRVSNGLLLRRDMHALFDRGYLTVTPELHLEVSRRIREEFENGRDYYRFHGQEVRRPRRGFEEPDRGALTWHNENVFRG